MNVDLSVYLVTDRRLSGARGVTETVRRAVGGGVRMVQLRDKDATDATVVAQLLELSRVIDGRATLVVNDRVDAAIEARRQGAKVDGVHLGQSDTSAHEARERLGPDAVVGLSANTPAHLDAVAELPPGTVDYLGVGAVHPTATKADHPPVLGIDGFGKLARSTTLPCVAIGGITRADVAPLRTAGAAGIAVVSAISAAPDPQAAAADFRAVWRRAGIPRVLAIAGSDPSGGAGIQADLKSIAANGGYGMAVITALTAQNTRGVSGVHVPPTEFLRAQLEAISDDIQIDAVKVGMLANAEVIRTVADWLRSHRPPLVVIDPVMVSTSGARLLDADAEDALRGILPLADLVTPNLSELAVLTGTGALESLSEAMAVGSELADRLGTRVLVKGGHLTGEHTTDVLVGAGETVEFDGTRINTPNTHGTGCSLASAIATRLASGEGWVPAVDAAREWLRESLRASGVLHVGEGHGPINHFAGLWSRAGLATAPTVGAFADSLWAGIAEVRRQIDDLPFVRALADGTLKREAFLAYLAQDALYLREYARMLAEAAVLAPTSTEQAFWAHAAENAIIGELELHASWISPDQGAWADTFSATASAVNRAYLSHLRSAAFGGDYAVLIAALLPCFWLYSDLGTRFHAGDFGEYATSPEHPYANWLATYGDPEFEETTARAIEFVAQAAVAQGPEQRDRMTRAFEISSEFERDFFDDPRGAGLQRG